MRALFIVIGLMAPASALACVVAAGGVPWRADPAETALDAVPPGAPAFAVVAVKRGAGLVQEGCSDTAAGTSCDDLGWLELTAWATDDRTPQDELAMELDLVGGELPGGLGILDEPWRWRSGHLMLTWADGAGDEQESFSFRMRARAVDRAGNRGPWSKAVVVESDGSGTGGCSAGGGAATLLAVAALAQLILLEPAGRRSTRPAFGSAPTSHA